MDDVRAVLIYRLGSVGDTVVALPSLRSTAARFPGARKCLLTNFTDDSKAAPMAAVLDGMGLVDEYIEYPIALRGPLALLRLWHRVRRVRPDVLVYLAEPRGLLKTWRDAVFFKLCGIRRMVGVPYTRAMRLPRAIGSGVYESEAARLFRCIGASAESNAFEAGAFDLCLRDAERAEARELLGQLNIQRPYLAFSIGAKVTVKDWGVSNWAELLRRLRGLLRMWNVVAVGVEAERAATDELLRPWRDAALNLCGRLSVRASAAALENARVFVGHDSGPMHLAAAVSTPCVAIFSARSLPGEWYPHGNIHEVIYHSVPCRGCKKAVCVKYRKQCIASIAVDEVLGAVHRVLGRGGGSPRSASMSAASRPFEQV